MREVNYIKLTELVDVIVDNRGKTVPTVENGIPLIATNCIKEDSVFPSFEKVRYISQETYDTWFRAHLEPFDILFVNKGTPGRSCLVPDPVNFVAAQDMVGLRFKEEYHPYYMLAVIRSNEIKKTIANNHVGLVIPHFRKKELLNLKLPILEKKLRNNIGEIYKSISLKIEVNNKINQELESMVKLIYDYWFVQFDFPDANGKPYKSSGGKMEFNKKLKREIPEGWDDGSLVDIASYVNGIACQKYRPDSDEFLPVIKIREMRDGFTSNTEKVKADIPDKVKVFDGDILFSWSASLVVMQWSGGKGGLNQHIFKVTSAKYPKSFFYFELLNYLEHFKMVAELRKTTMGHITRDHLKQSKIVIPPLEITKQLDEKLKPILDKQVLLQKENQKLAELRDWLLPMLMNGQVTVGEVKSELGMVAEDNGKYGEL